MLDTCSTGSATMKRTAEDDFVRLATVLKKQDLEALEAFRGRAVVKFASVQFDSADRFFGLLFRNDAVAWAFLLGTAALRASYEGYSRIHQVSPFWGQEVSFAQYFGCPKMFVQMRGFPMPPQLLREAVAQAGLELRLQACFLFVRKDPSERELEVYHVPMPD